MYALSAHLVVHADAMGAERRDPHRGEGAACGGSFGIDHTTLQIESASYAHVDDVHRH